MYRCLFISFFFTERRDYHRLHNNNNSVFLLFLPPHLFVKRWEGSCCCFKRETIERVNLMLLLDKNEKKHKKKNKWTNEEVKMLLTFNLENLFLLLNFFLHTQTHTALFVSKRNQPYYYEQKSCKFFIFLKVLYLLED